MNAASIVYGLAFARGGSEVVSAGYDGTALSWEASGRSPLERAVATAARTGGIDEVAVNRAGTLIATANRNGSANVWNGASLAELRGLSGSPEAITTVAFAPSGDRLAVGLNGGGVAFVDAASDKAAGTLPAPRGERGPVNVVAFGPGGLVAVGEASGYVFIWSLAHRRVRLLHKLRRGAGSGVTALAFDPAADSLAVTFNDSGRIQVYSLGNRTWRPITVSEGIWSLAFADRGAELLAGDNQGAVELFDPGNGARIGTLPGAGQPVYGLAISPDGETVATTDGAGRLRFWDLAGQVELGQPITTGSSTFSLAFSGNGARLVTGDVDGTLAAFSPLFWSRDGAAVSRYLCPRVGRNLSAEQWSEDVPGQPYHATC
jgi:WD40 repeat protein